MVKRLINLVKLVSSYFISRLLRQVVHWGTPVSLSIEPTNYCNLHCPECPSGTNLLTRKRGIIDFILFMNLVDQLSPALSYLNLYFQGEPFIHPLLPEMAEYAKSKKIYVSTSTNGHFINDENAKSIVSSGLDKLIISLDGADAESYGHYRIGGNFDAVIAGIRKIINEKKTQGTKKPKVVLQSLILKSNQHQFNQIRQLGKDLGVDKVELKTAQFYDFKEGNPLMPDDLKFSRYKRISDTPGKPASYKIKNALPDHCSRMWSSCVVTWDGSVVPCCFDKDAKYNMGKVNGRSFKKVWKDKSYYDFRKKILHSRKSIDICTNCIEGTGVTCFL